MEPIEESNQSNFAAKHQSKHEYHSRNKRAFDSESGSKKQCAIMYKNENPIGILEVTTAHKKVKPKVTKNP